MMGTLRGRMRLCTLRTAHRSGAAVTMLCWMRLRLQKQIMLLHITNKVTAHPQILMWQALS